MPGVYAFIRPSLMLIPKQGVCYHTARRPGSYTVTVPNHWPLFFRPHVGTRPTSRVRCAQTLSRRLLPDTDRPGSREVLLPPRPLRTVLETCASYGSSIH